MTNLFKRIGYPRTFLKHKLTSIRAAGLLGVLLAQGAQAETIGGGTLGTPAVGPLPSFGLGNDYTLVKNWNFGSGGIIKNITDMNTEFQYHDQFNSIGPDIGYGTKCVAPSTTTAISGQPVQGVNTSSPVREFFTDSLRTYIVPLDGATEPNVASYNTGSGSFVAKYNLANGGSLLEHDIIWETRVRYTPFQYFWFAIWAAGNEWTWGAEEDVVESYGYNNAATGGGNNYNGLLFHSNSVGGSDEVGYFGNWSSSMSYHGITSYNPNQYHIWTWVYRANDTYEAYLDGVLVNKGSLVWTLSGKYGNLPLRMFFLFDGVWGNATYDNVRGTIPLADLAGKYYEWDYSRIYMRVSPHTPKFQAEAYTSQSGCASSTANSGYTGSSFMDFGGNGTYVEWNNLNHGTGTKSVSFRYANGGTTNRQCQLRVNGNVVGNLTFAPTGSWTTWAKTPVISFPAVSGNNTIRITANTADGGPNVDRMDCAVNLSA